MFSLGHFDATKQYGLVSENVCKAQDWAEVSVLHIKEKSFKGEIKCPFGQVKMALKSSLSID